MDRPKNFTPEKGADPKEMLERLGIENLDLVLPLQRETDEQGGEIDADIFWVRYKVPEGEAYADLAPVEGKIYLPRKANGELVHFSPGYPGGNGGRFEQLYAKAITDAGYALSTHRFNGTSLTGPDAAEILNSPQRIEYAKQHGEQHIGGEQVYGPVDVVNQPIIPLASLQKMFKRINLIGHSMGVAANNISVTRLGESDPEIAGKIGNMICLAGFVGRGEKPEGGPAEGLKMDFITLAQKQIKKIKSNEAMAPTDPTEFVAQLKEVSASNAHVKIPEQAGQIMIFTPEDPFIAGPQMEAPGALTEYGPKAKRKAIVQDKTGLGKEKPHSMLWVSPENMVRALGFRVPKGVYGVTLPVEKGEKLFTKEKE